MCNFTTITPLLGIHTRLYLKEMKRFTLFSDYINFSLRYGEISLYNDVPLCF